MSERPRKRPATDDARVTDEGTDLHPAPEDLVAYHRRELDEQAVARLHAHLSDCSGCAELVLDLVRYGLLPSAPPWKSLSKEELGRERRRLEERLRDRGGDGE